MEALDRDFEPVLDEGDFLRLVSLVRSHCGYILSDRQKDGLCRRVLTRLEALGLDSFADYCAYLVQDTDGCEMGQLIGWMRHQSAGLFADAQQVKFLAEWLTILAKKRGPASRIRIWVAGPWACEDAYTLAMVASAYMKNLSRYDFRILATDLDETRMAQGQQGVFRTQEVDKVPASLKARWLTRTSDIHMQVDTGLRDFIDFKQFNVLNDLPVKRAFDAVLMRRAMPDLERPHRMIILRKFRDRLLDDGRLYLSTNEGLASNQWFEAIGPGMFKKRTRVFHRLRLV
ncbi:chemotaxis protein methyltransferase [Roseibium aquae]|uniref:protein-glutamate O-methyltransferase n=1 Tax=Roseibium aquae TaxID=1323746 RepID=A0A916WZZ9_9HYPH|nr:CheR family methyltransferase [Roseibium aquae]GGB46980.1 chemotaxis protein methyltransferase [Roseibium aquae]